MSDSVDHPPLPKTAQRLGLRQDCNPERRRPFCNTTAGETALPSCGRSWTVWPGRP